MSRFWRWLAVAVGIPLAAWLLDRLGRRIEARRERATTWSRILRAPKELRTRRRHGRAWAH